MYVINITEQCKLKEMKTNKIKIEINNMNEKEL